MTGPTGERPCGDVADLLPFHVAGTLEGAEKEEVAQHIVSCPVCQEQVRALASMRETLERHGRDDHVPVTDLVDYEAIDPSRTAVERAAIEDHLTRCSACREDLAALRGASSRSAELETAGRSPGPAVARTAIGSRPHARRVVTAATLVLAVVIIGAAILARSFLRRSGAEAPWEGGLRQVDVVAFMPERRGDSEERVLKGSGPWVIRIVLPFDAADGPYRVTIVRADEVPLPGRETTIAAETAGQITFLLPPLSAPASYRVIVRPTSDPTGEEIYAYPFLVVAGEEAGGGIDR